MYYLLCDQQFLSRFEQNDIFTSSFLSFWVWICPNILRFCVSLFGISPSQCATKDSAAQSTHTILVVRPAHNLPIALQASPLAILLLFQFEHTIAFQPVHLFQIDMHFQFGYVWTSFVSFHVSCAPIWQQASAEPSTNTFFVAWPAHNKLIALPASPTLILL